MCNGGDGLGVRQVKQVRRVSQENSPLFHSDPELVEVSLPLLLLLAPPPLLDGSSLLLVQQELQAGLRRAPQLLQLLLEQEFMEEGLQARRLFGLRGPAGGRRGR